MADEDAKKGKKGKDDKGKKKPMAIALVLLAAAGAWFFLLRSPSAADEHHEPVPGEVVAVDPITVNLQGGRFLRIGLGIHIYEHTSLSGASHTDSHSPSGGATSADGAKALDAVIELFSGQKVEDLSGAYRQNYKTKLLHMLQEAYHDTVYDVYFTEFVMQ